MSDSIKLEEVLSKENIEGATKASDIIKAADNTVIDYLDLIFDTISRDVIESVYKVAVKHTTSKFDREVPYKSVARIASTIAIDMLSVLEEKDITIFTEDESDDI